MTTDDDVILKDLPWLRRLAQRLAYEEADDLVQETWTLARRDRPTAGPGGLRPWLMTAMRHRWLSMRRSAESRRRRENLVAADGRDDPGPEQLAIEADVIRIVEQALAELGDEERAVLRERFFDERTAVEIAAKLGVPAATVRTRIRRSLMRLRVVLDQRHGNDRTRWARAVLAIPTPRIASLGKTATMASIKKFVIAGAVVGAVALPWLCLSNARDTQTSTATISAPKTSLAGVVADDATADPAAKSEQTTTEPKTTLPSVDARRSPSAEMPRPGIDSAETPTAADPMVEACAFHAHEYEEECDFLEPDDVTLELMAKCGVVRYDFPAMFARADETPAFDDRWLDLVGATANERAELIELGDEFRGQLFSQLDELAMEAALPVWPTDVSLLTAVVSLNKRYGDEAVKVAAKRLAHERAGLTEPPETLVGLPAAERFVRMFSSIGEDFEAAIAKRLGPARARELRIANDGWPGLKFQTGRIDACR